MGLLSGVFGSEAPSINRKEMKRFREATMAAGAGNDALIQEYEQFMQNMQSYTTGLLEQVVGGQMDAFADQLAMSKTMFNYAQQDREYYNQVYRPLREQFAKKAAGYDTVDRRQAASGRAQANVAQAFAAAKRNEQARLEGFGIDPSESRGMALDKNIAIERAKAQAQAGTQAANRVEDVGLQLQDQAIRQGDPLLNRDVNQMALANQFGATAGNMGSTALGGVGNIYGLNMGAYGQGSNMYGQSANIYNSAANQMLGVHDARMGTHYGSPDTAQSLWGLAGTAFGTYAGTSGGSQKIGSIFSPPVGASEGGVVPTPEEAGVPTVRAAPGTDPRGTDRTPASLTPGEFVIPEEAVRWKGEEYFHKQVAKAREDSAKAKGAPAGAIPAQGGM